MKILQSIIAFIPKYMSGMILLLVYLALAASWVAGMVFKLIGNQFFGAFLNFIFPPYGIGSPWIAMYKEESLNRKLNR